MEEIAKEVSSLDSVKAVRNHNGNLTVELFSRQEGERYRIPADLSKAYRNIKEVLNRMKKEGKISGWERLEKPQKQYRDDSHVDVSDRKTEGYNRDSYVFHLD